ncbi:MAG: hypothetical protein KGK30_07975, partial [Elusimicrobia bacterium]|nr:hypothetical protein [Elusimicrobiota bacterium]
MRLGLEGAVMMIALALGAAAPARAAAPDLLSYQGRLLESGIPASGTRFVDLQLCPGPTGGVCTDLGTTQVTATSGLFKLNFSVPSAIDLSAGPWYLQVSAGSSGTNLQALTPREELTSAPYALYASSAAALSNGAVILRSTSTSVGYAVLDVLDTSGNELMRVQQDGSVGIGALFPSDALEIESQSKPAVSISAFGGSVWSQVKLKSFPSAQGQPFTASPANAKLGEVGFYG